jgi:hypothetical protein
MTATRAERDREKVDGFLRQALAETDSTVRAHLIGKASYWHQVARKNASQERQARREGHASIGKSAREAGANDRQMASNGPSSAGG